MSFIKIMKDVNAHLKIIGGVSVISLKTQGR